jgi:hypothetical protein
MKTILHAVLGKLTETQGVKNSAAIKTTQRLNGTFAGALLWPLVMNQTEFSPNPFNLFYKDPF